MFSKNIWWALVQTDAWCLIGCVWNCCAMIVAWCKLITVICWIFNFWMQAEEMERAIGRKMKLGFVKFYQYMIGNLMIPHFLQPSSRKAVVKLLVRSWNGRAKEDLSYRRRLEFFNEGKGRFIWVYLQISLPGCVDFGTANTILAPQEVFKWRQHRKV